MESSIVRGCEGVKMKQFYSVGEYVVNGALWFLMGMLVGWGWCVFFFFDKLKG